MHDWQQEPLVFVRRGGRTYHSTQKCPRFPRGKPGYSCTYDEAYAADMPPCHVCCPPVLHIEVAAEVGARMTYHRSRKCSALAPEYRRRVRPWHTSAVVWPTWEYGEVTTGRDYRRCPECIPSRHVLYPRGQRQRRRPKAA